MNDDPIALLERELVSAARRRNAGGPVPGAAPSRPGAASNIGGILAAVASAIVVIGVAAAILVTHHSPPARPAAGHSSAAGLAVLRRPQTPADRDPATLAQIRRVEASDPAWKADIGAMRLAGITPWGAKIVLVPFTTAAARPLMVFVGGALWGAGPEAGIDRRGIVARVVLARGKDKWLLLVAPDGVTTVSVVLGSLRPLTVPVQHNVATLRVPPGGADGSGAAWITWYGPNGRVVSRFQDRIWGPPVTAVDNTLSVSPLGAILAVLRRPQTAADRALPTLARDRGLSAPRTEAVMGVPDRAGARLAGVTPWGARVFLMPFLVPTQRQIDLLPASERAAARRRWRQGPALGIFTTNGGGGNYSVGNIQRGQAMIRDGGNAAPGRPRRLRIILVVPDGISRVELSIERARGARPRWAFETVRVRDNVATVAAADASLDNPKSMTWFGPNGQPVRKIMLPGG